MSGDGRDLAAKFRRASGVDTVAAPGPPEPAGVRWSKFTVKLEPAHAEQFDAIVLAARRALERRVDKSEVLRVLIDVMTEDAALRSQVHDRLQGG